MLVLMLAHLFTISVIPFCTKSDDTSDYRKVSGEGHGEGHAKTPLCWLGLYIRGLYILIDIFDRRTI